MTETEQRLSEIRARTLTLNRELTDILLPDAICEIEVRPHALLWPDTRSRPVITLTAGDQGGGNTGTGLPVIQNLHCTIEDGFSIIRWQVSEEANYANLAFGVWFDAAQLGLAEQQRALIAGLHPPANHRRTPGGWSPAMRRLRYSASPSYGRFQRQRLWALGQRLLWVRSPAHGS